MVEFFDGDRWQQRQLTHQLWALVHLRKNTEDTARIDRLIEHICDRLTGQLVYEPAVVDIYIQKIAFVLFAGHPDKIKRRWLERVIENQGQDGGWNDRWFCFSSRRKPHPNLKEPPSDQHATVQGLWLLYQVKYRYPNEFGLSRPSPQSDQHSDT